MNTPDLPNPFSNAQIIGPGNGSYHRKTVKRGDPQFVMSKSELFEFARCPARWLAGYKEDKSKEMAWGDMVDVMALTPERFAQRFVVAPATYIPISGKNKGEARPWNRNADVCKEWEIERGKEGLQVIKSDEAEEVLAAAIALRADPDVNELLCCSQKQIEIAAEYHDSETGLVIPFRGTVDLVPDKSHDHFGKCLADLKTTNCASLQHFARHIHSYGYHEQAAIYLDIWTAATQEDRCEFRFVIQESFAPFQVGRRILSQEFLEVGRRNYQSALRLYCQCLATNRWPDYEGTARSRIGSWAIMDPEAWML